VIYTGTGDKNIVNNGENAFTTNPRPILVFDLTVIERSGLVQINTTAVDRSRKGNLIRVEILPTRFALNLMGKVPKNVFNGIGYILDPSVEREVSMAISIIVQNPTKVTYRE
jgi:hypothetical protein